MFSSDVAKRGSARRAPRPVSVLGLFPCAEGAGIDVPFVAAGAGVVATGAAEGVTTSASLALAGSIHFRWVASRAVP
jgi:hypothetical protein